MTTPEQNSPDQPITSPEPRYYQPMPEDEINLVDLWLQLTRRRLLIGLILFGCLIAGGGYALLTEPKYEYKSLLEIGRISTGTLDNPLFVSIEDPINIEEKIRAGEIPVARITERGELEDVPEIIVSSPKESRLILLESEAKLTDQALVQSLHSVVFDQVVDEHAAISKATLSRYRAHLAIEQDRLKRYLKDPQTSPYTQDMQGQKVEQIEATIERMRPTRVIRIAVQSEKSTGPGKAMILALSGLLGLMGGIIIALLAEFVVNAQKTQRR